MDIITEKYSFITYEIYCEAIDRVFDDTLTESTFDKYIEEGIFDHVKKMKSTFNLN